MGDRLQGCILRRDAARVLIFFGVHLLAILTGCVWGSSLLRVNRSFYRLPNSEQNREAAARALEQIRTSQGFQVESRSDHRQEFTLQWLLEESSAQPIQLKAFIEKPTWNFEPSEILELESLARRLKHPHTNDTLSTYLEGRLGPETRSLLAKFSGGPDLRLKARLAADLSRVANAGKVSGGTDTLYTPARFAGVRLSSETERLLNERPEGTDLAWLNRFLLQEAYPELEKAFRDGRIRVDLFEKRVASAKTSKFATVETQLTSVLRETFGQNIFVHSESYRLP